MSNKNPFKSPYHSAKIIKFKIPDNYNYLNFIQELEELKESLKENVDNDYKLLSILYTAMNKYNESNEEIYNSCSEAFNSITGLPSNLDSNIKINRIELIIIGVISVINDELQKLKNSKTTDTNDEIPQDGEDR